MTASAAGAPGAVTERVHGRLEEAANGLTHAVALVLAVAGLAVLALAAAASGQPARIVGCVVFGAALVVLYLTSTLYHSLPIGRPKAVLRVLDHSAIFLVIAGTYTPFTLVVLPPAWGWSLFAVVWTLALAGISLRLVLRQRPQALFLAMYLAMGWCIVVAARPLAAALAPAGLGLLVAGGLAYTVGVVFYVWHRLPFHHAVWHGFVMAGSAFHYFAVLLFVARA